MNKELETILPLVQKPARYTGGEYGQIMKDKSGVELRMALCFPDVYEIGMSNLGLRILYECINRMDGVWCERCFAPWFDMDEQMRAHGLPLTALESGDPLSEFDALGFSMGYEMADTTVLEMLDLAGIPIRSADRPGLTPLIFAGGSACCNGEPMADFFDLMVIGEGEDADCELLELLRKAKREGWSKAEFLRAASALRGVYVPSLYTPVYGEDGVQTDLIPAEGAPETVTKAIMQDFEHSVFPTQQIVPSTEVVHDRVTLELFRGCIRGCRFCQAGQIYRPVRARSVETLVQQGREALEYTGYQELTLSSLSSSDYKGLSQLCDGLIDYCEPRGIGFSLPSLRADNFSMEIMERVQKVRKSGLTFAPEAGTQRLRDVINKNVTEEDLLHSCAVAFSGGWNGVKLYFMLGLPTETDEDVIGISELVDKVVHCWRENASNKARGCRITVSTSCFVPKPHTAFQWEPQVTREEYMRRVKLLRDTMKARSVTYNWHDDETSHTEAVLSRGDRRVGALLESIWRKGGYLESWSEGFSYSRWTEAAEECGLSLDFYANRRRAEDEFLPWQRLNMGVTQSFLLREKHQAEKGVLSPDCRHGCSGCGASAFLKEGKCNG